MTTRKAVAMAAALAVALAACSKKQPVADAPAAPKIDYKAKMDAELKARADQKQADAAAGQQALSAAADEDLKQRGTAAVRRMMKDPESAQFRNLEVKRGGLCGEVNARNGFGGYVGFREFVFDDEGAVVRDNDLGTYVALNRKADRYGCTISPWTN